MKRTVLGLVVLMSILGTTNSNAQSFRNSENRNQPRMEMRHNGGARITPMHHYGRPVDRPAVTVGMYVEPVPEPVPVVMPEPIPEPMPEPMPMPQPAPRPHHSNVGNVVGGMVVGGIIGGVLGALLH